MPIQATNKTQQKYKQVMNVWNKGMSYKDKESASISPNKNNDICFSKIKLICGNFFTKNPLSLTNDEKIIFNTIAEALFSSKGWNYENENKDNKSNTNSSGEVETNIKQININGEGYQLKRTIEKHTCKITLSPVKQTDNEVSGSKTHSTLFPHCEEHTLLKCNTKDLAEELVKITTKIYTTVETTVSNLFETCELGTLKTLYPILNNPQLDANNELQIDKNLKNAFKNNEDLEAFKLYKHYALALKNYSKDPSISNHEASARWIMVIDKALSNNPNFKSISTIPQRLNSILANLSEDTKPENKIEFLKICLEITTGEINPLDKESIINEINSNIFNNININDYELVSLIDGLFSLATLKPIKSLTPYFDSIIAKAEKIISEQTNRLSLEQKVYKLFETCELGTLKILFPILNNPQLDANNELQIDEDLKNAFKNNQDLLEDFKLYKHYALALKNYSKDLLSASKHEALARWRMVIDKALSNNPNFKSISTIPQRLNSILANLSEDTKPENKIEFLKICLEITTGEINPLDKESIINEINSNIFNNAGINQDDLVSLVNGLFSLATLEQKESTPYMHSIIAQAEKMISEQFEELSIENQSFIIEYICLEKLNRGDVTIDDQEIRNLLNNIDYIANKNSNFTAFLLDRLKFILIQKLQNNIPEKDNPEIKKIRIKYLGNDASQVNLTTGNFGYLDCSKGSSQISNTKIPNFGDLHASAVKLLAELKRVIPLKTTNKYDDMVKLCEKFQDNIVRYPNLSFFTEIKRVTHSTAEQKQFIEAFNIMLNETFDVSNVRDKQALAADILARWMGDSLHDRNGGDLIVLLIFAFLDKHNIQHERITGNHEMAQILRIIDKSEDADKFAGFIFNTLPNTPALKLMIKSFFSSESSVLINYKNGEFYSHSPFDVDKFLSGCKKIGVTVSETLEHSISSEPIIKISEDDNDIPDYLNNPTDVLNIKRALLNIPKEIPDTEEKLEQFITCCDCLGIQVPSILNMSNVNIKSDNTIKLLEATLNLLKQQQELSKISRKALHQKTVGDYINLAKVRNIIDSGRLPKSLMDLTEAIEKNGTQLTEEILNHNIREKTDITQLIEKLNTNKDDIPKELKTFLNDLLDNSNLNLEISSFVANKSRECKTIGIDEQFEQLCSKILKLEIPKDFDSYENNKNLSATKMEFLKKVEDRYKLKQFLKFCTSLGLIIPAKIQNMGGDYLNNGEEFNDELSVLRNAAVVKYKSYLEDQEKEFISLINMVNTQYRKFVNKAFSNPESITADEIEGYKDLLTVYKNSNSDKWLNDKTKQSMSERFKFIKVHVSGHDPASQQEQFHRGNVSTDNNNYKYLPILGIEPIYFSMASKTHATT